MSRPLFGEQLPLRPAAPSSRLTGMRFTFSQLLGSSETVASPLPVGFEPKPPSLGLRGIAPVHLDIPSPFRSPAVSPVSPSAYSLPSPLESPISPADSTQSLYRSPTIPSPVYREFPDELLAGVDPEEQQLADIVRQEQRRRRKHKRRRHHRSRRGQKSRYTCFPSITHPSVRRKFFTSFISGILLIILLTTYLSLALSNRASGRVFHVLFILVIVALTVVFCHSLIRLCMLALRPTRTVHQSCAARRAEEAYARTEEPIEVVGDEEEALGFKSTDAVKPPPPAYGFLRGSVRVDPNQIFWQRHADPVYADHPAYRQGGEDEVRPTTATQPPEYEEGQAF